MEELVQHGAAGAAASARPRIAIERVLADIEVEGREIDRHEVGEEREEPLVIKDFVGRPHLPFKLVEAVQDVAVKLRHLVDEHVLPVMQAVHCAQDVAHGVAELAIGLDVGLEDFRPESQVLSVIGGRHP